MWSLSDVEERLYEAMDEAGATPASGQHFSLEDGRLVRYRIDGDKRNSKNGAFSVHLDERPAGWVQNWKTDVKVTFTLRGMEPLSNEEKEHFRQQMEQSRVQRAEDTEKSYAEAAQKAQLMWSSGGAADPEFPYLKKKKVRPYTLRHGMNEVIADPETGEQRGGDEDVLYVPILDKDTNKLINIQQIYKSGKKYPLNGGRMGKVYSPIKNKNDKTGPILICEGWATGAALYRITGHAVICAMTAGNLMEIARMSKQKAGEREVIICADNDHETERRTGKNTGRVAATKAALACGIGAPIYPDFEPEEDGSDWNDYLCLHGENAAVAHFKEKYEASHVMAESVETSSMNPALFPDIAVKSGKPLGTIENVEALLKFYKIQVKYNETTKDQEIVIPGYGDRSDNLQEVNNNRITSLAARHEIPLTKVGAYIDVIAENNRYNPVRDWIGSVDWDGTPRLTKFIATIEPKKGFDTYTSDMMIRLWMTACVAAVFETPMDGRDPFSTPGVLVLQGDQGCGKTTWFRNLAPRGSGWVGEGRSVDPNKKDTMMAALRFWITELGELESTLRRDMAMLKAFITDTKDVIRIPYSKKCSVFPRRTVFGASVNQAEFLSDLTGSRRWWCIPVEKINNDHGIDIQQVWAEVYSSYEDGATWYPTDEQNQIILKASWQFTFPDPVMDMVLAKFNWEDYEHSNTAPFSATEVLKMCGFDKPTQQEVRNCGVILRKLTKREPHKGTDGRRLYYLPTSYYGGGLKD